MKLDPDSTLKRLRRVAWIATGVFSLGGLVWGLPFAVGALSGGLLALVNLHLIESVVQGMTAKRPGWLSWLGVFGILLRYILLSLALFVIIGVWHANVVAIALGLSAPVAAVFVECGLYFYREFMAKS